MTSLKQWLVITVFSALACSAMNAQTVNLKANIPFDFQVGDKLMPAGPYEVRGEGKVLIVRPANPVDAEQPLVTVLTLAALDNKLRDLARLEFKRYENTYFLRSIWDQGSADGRELVPDAREKELAKRNKPFVTIIKAAR